MVEQGYIQYLPIHSMPQASQLSLSMTASCEPNGHSCVWMSNVSAPHMNCVCLTSDILSLDFREPLWWLLSQDGRLDDASLSEDTPSRFGHASWWVDVHGRHISEQLHKPLSVLIHILWQHRKSMKAAQCRKAEAAGPRILDGMYLAGEITGFTTQQDQTIMPWEG